MSKYRLSEDLGNIDETFLEEVFEYKKRERISIKKIAAVAACAALIIGVGALALRPQAKLPAEPPAAVATEPPIHTKPNIIDIEKSYSEKDGTFYFTKIGGSDVLRSFFRRSGHRELNNDKNESAKNLPIIEDVGEIMTEFNSNGIEETEERFRLVSAICDKYTFYGTVEFDATGIDFPEDVPDDLIDLWFVTTNQNFGRHPEVRFVSREGDIFTYILRITDEGEMPESFTINIGCVGYYTGSKWGAYNKIKYLDADLTVNRSDLNVLDSAVAKNIGVVDGIMEIKAEVFPFGLLVTFDEAQAEQWQKESEIAKEHGWDWYKYSMGTVYAFLKIEMKDGTVYDQYYDLTCNIDTWRDLENDEEGVKHIRYTFVAPLDVSQIAKITYCGAEFEF